MQLRCLVLIALVAPAYALIGSCPALGSHTSGWRAPAVRLEFVEEKADQPQTTTAASTISAEQAREEAALKFTGIDPFHPLRIARPEKDVFQNLFPVLAQLRENQISKISEKLFSDCKS